MTRKVLGLCLKGLLGILFVAPLLADEQKTEEYCAPSPQFEIDTPATEYPPIDVDAMAARLKSNQDIYKEVRDSALAEYAKLHPQPNPYDIPSRTAIRLYAYLTVWDDYYQENLWKRGVAYCRQALDQGSTDPFIQTFKTLQGTIGFSSSTEETTQKVNRDIDRLLESHYPSLFKLWACKAAIDNLTRYYEIHNPSPQEPSMQARPHFVGEWGKNYRELIRQGKPHSFLFFLGDNMLDTSKYDINSLYLVIGEADRAFAETDPGNPVTLELDGVFYTCEAWNARGGDGGETVSDKQGKIFKERLAKAAQILEPLYVNHPDELGTCYAMTKVELGQGNGRDVFEKWFQRAIHIDPDNFEIYLSKEWYLQPRWYGSVDDLLAYGRECVRTQNWESKLPLILTTGLSGAEDNSLYARLDLWGEIAGIYREYLARYPDAIFYRTSFAKHAYDGGHRETAREQLKILGRNWDVAVIPIKEHASMTSDLGLKDGLSH